LAAAVAPLVFDRVEVFLSGLNQVRKMHFLPSQKRTARYNPV